MVGERADSGAGSAWALASHGISSNLMAMSLNAAQLLERALELSEDERAELIVRLLDTMRDTLESAPGDDSAVLEAAWIEEARRRLHEIKAARVKPAPWSEARERIFAREP